MKIFSIIILAVIISSCSIPGRDLVKDGTTQMDMSASKKMSVVKVKVNASEKNAIVRGLVVRENPRRIGKGYVTVDLYNERGVRIDSVDAKVNFARRGSKSAQVGRFKAELEENVPANSRIVVKPMDKRLEPAKESSGTMAIE